MDKRFNTDIELSWTQTHTPIFVPPHAGVKGMNMKAKLSQDPTGPDKDLRMWLQGNGSVLLETRGQLVVIPAANVVNCVVKKG